MRPADLQVKVGGSWLRLLGHVTGVTYSTRYADGPCGPDLASCQVRLDRRDDIGFLRLGQTFEVYDRGVIVFGGKVSGIGRGTSRRVEAKGWPRVAFDSSLTSAPGTKVGREALNRETTPAAETTHRWLLDASDLRVGGQAIRLTPTEMRAEPRDDGGQTVGAALSMTLQYVTGYGDPYT